MTRMDFWKRMESPGPSAVLVDGIEVRAGSRVRLRPRSRGDVFDLALDGRLAVVDSVEQDQDGEFQVAVTLAEDPGRDLGEARLPGHRFFFSVADVEALVGADSDGSAARRVLVAGIGNLFLGDDGFGVEVVRRLAEVELPPEVDVVDFGIRGMDLLYALQRGYDAVIFVDALPRGEVPGTVSVVEPELPTDGAAAVEAHGMDPISVLRLAQQLGPVPARTLVVGCEPQTVPDLAGEDVLVELSDPVRTAVGEAADLVEALVTELGARAPAGDERKGGDTR